MLKGSLLVSPRSDPAEFQTHPSFYACRVRATDGHCRQMRRNNKFGAKNCNLATTIGERKIASENFCLASERDALC